MEVDEIQGLYLEFFLCEKFIGNISQDYLAFDFSYQKDFDFDFSKYKTVYLWLEISTSISPYLHSFF